MTKIEAIYEEIFQVLEKYENETTINLKNIRTDAKNHIFGVKLVEKYGFEINPKQIYNTSWQDLGPDLAIGFYDGTTSQISYPDDGRQPEGEILLRVCQSSGAYSLGRDYPEATYNQFFEELKSYNPKYTDTNNHSLYFSLENAGKIYNDYYKILDRYMLIAKQENKKKRIESLKKELSELSEEG